MLEGIEGVLIREKPDSVVVYGDTNSTLAGAWAAVKLHIPIAHVEAGLRSHNKRMPEETNRILTDHGSDYLFCPTQTSVHNLMAEGLPYGTMVGDVMYDATLSFKPIYSRRRSELLKGRNLQLGNYFIATVHRAENTNCDETLLNIIRGLNRVSHEIAPVLWPIHPRTRKRMKEMNASVSEFVHQLEPLGYIQMQAYLTGARGVLTDSGGLQKEAAFHGIKTITLRNETEWGETVEAGCNVLVGTQPDRIFEAARKCSGEVQPCLAFGAGNAARLIVNALL